MRIGFHVSVGKGLAPAARRAHAIGCECLQIFVRNARGWRARAYPDDEVDEFHRLLVEHGLAPVVVHSSYLVNLASPHAELLEKSRQTMADDMARAARLGSPMVSVHSGHYMGAGLERGLRTLAASVRWVLDRAPNGVDLLLENAAGQGHQLGSDWEEFARLLDELGGDGRVGICLDTCHAHAAGYRLDSARWVGRALRGFGAALGMERLRLIHLNDSRGPAGGKVDRHEHIGRGTIGDRGLRALLRRRDLQGICAILETPVDRANDDARNIRHVRRLIGKGAKRGKPAARRRAQVPHASGGN